MSGGRFPTTRWSRIVTTRDGNAEESRQELTFLCEVYWQPLYLYVRRRGVRRDAAEDLVQGFFASFLRKNYIANLDPKKGRFRSYLLSALAHYENNERERENAVKRGRDVEILPIDFTDGEHRYLAEPVTNIDPEKLYERSWALAVMDATLRRLRSRYDARGQVGEYDYLLQFLAEETEETQYSHVSTLLGVSVSAVKMKIHRLRKEHRETLREEIADTVVDAAEIDDEVRFLRAALDRV